MPHQLGTSIQSLGPLDGNGGVADGLAVKCFNCSGRFMIARARAKLKLGSSIWNIIGAEAEVTCPYCSHRDSLTTSGQVLSDCRPTPVWD